MWYFNKINPGEPERDSREGEFFTSDNPSNDIVREFIQNSLDARTDDKCKIIIQFGELEREKISHYLEGLEEHLRASVLIPREWNGPKIKYLTLEDFGTSGLDGSTERSDTNCNFYNFWWREGISKKAGRKAGRWGLGKITYFKLSKIRTIFGFTVREDDNRKLLMGKAHLKVHELNGQAYHYYGYYRKEDYQPFDDEYIINEFRSHFSLKRNGEYGFSVVIPFYNDEISYSLVLKSVIINYCYAILKGMLEVKLEHPEYECLLNSELLERIFRALNNWQDTEWENFDGNSFISFLKEAINVEDYIITKKLTENEINEEFLENLEDVRDKFQNNQLLAFKIPIDIHKVDGESNEGFIKVFIKSDRSLEKAQEMYIRSGISITGIKTLGNTPVNTLLVVDEFHTEQFLGDSEEPSHKNWNERTEGFKDKYLNSVNTLRKIKNCVKNLITLISKPPSDIQIDFLREIFSIRVDEAPENPGNGNGSGENIPRLPQKAKLFNIERTENGFIINATNHFLESDNLQMKYHLKFAYDSKGGNPFKLYDKNDFTLDKLELSIQGCNVFKKGGNYLDFEVTDPHRFKISIQGFDNKRDLIINLTELSSI